MVAEGGFAGEYGHLPEAGDSGDEDKFNLTHKLLQSTIRKSTPSPVRRGLLEVKADVEPALMGSYSEQSLLVLPKPPDYEPKSLSKKSYSTDEEPLTIRFDEADSQPKSYSLPQHDYVPPDSHTVSPSKDEVISEDGELV